MTEKVEEVFQMKNLSIEELSYLLWATQGVNRHLS